MESGQEKTTWRDNLHTPSREEQHKYYGGEIESCDFDIENRYDLREWALKTDRDMCAANPILEQRWCNLELDWLIYEHNKDKGVNDG